MPSHALVVLCLLRRLARAGNVSVHSGDAAIAYSAGWAPIELDTSVLGNTFDGNTLYDTNQNGATATLSFTGDSVWFVTTRFNLSGSATFTLDGVALTTISFNSATTIRNFAALVADNLANGAHTLQVTTVLTGDQPLLDVEGFIYHVPDAVAPAPVAPSVAAASPSPTTQTVTASATLTPTSDIALSSLTTTSRAPSALTTALSTSRALVSSSRFVVALSASRSVALSPQANVAGSDQAIVSPPPTSAEDDDATSPALVPALAATGGIAALYFVSLTTLYFLRRRRRANRGDLVVGSSLIDAWSEGVARRMEAQEKVSVVDKPSRSL